MNMAKTNNDYNFTLEEFIKQLYIFSNYNAWHFFQKNLKQNLKIVKADTILNGRAKLIMKEMPVPDYDFNLLKAMVDMRIQGISKYSNAYKLGLRNEQQILSVWYPNEVEKSITLEIKDQIYKSKIIKIAPVYRLKLTPQYIKMTSSNCH